MSGRDFETIGIYPIDSESNRYIYFFDSRLPVMRLARIETSDGPVTGQYQDDVVHTADGTYEAGIDGNLLLACEPSALYCVGRNYAETLEQMEYERPEEPDFFIKSPASLRGHGSSIRCPASN